VPPPPVKANVPPRPRLTPMQPRVPPPNRLHVPKLIQRRYTVQPSMTARGIEREMPLEAEAAPHEDGDEAVNLSDAELGEAAEDEDECEAASDAEAPPEDGDEAGMASEAEAAPHEDGGEAGMAPDAELGEAAEDVDECETASDAEAASSETAYYAEMASNAELAEADEDEDEAATWPWRRRQRSRRT
jgi:hypothetical protein